LVPSPANAEKMGELMEKMKDSSRPGAGDNRCGGGALGERTGDGLNTKKAPTAICRSDGKQVEHAVNR